MISRGGRAPERGNKGGIRGVDSLSDCGQESWPEGIHEGSGEGISTANMVQRKGGKLWPRARLPSLPIQGGQREGVDSPLTMGGCRANIGYGAMVAWLLPHGGGYPIGPSVGPHAMTLNGVLEEGNNLEHT